MPLPHVLNENPRRRQFGITVQNIRRGRVLRPEERARTAISGVSNLTARITRTRIAVAFASWPASCGVRLKYALLNPRSCPCGLAPDSFIIFRDVARRCMVISQVIHKNHCLRRLRLPFTSVPLPFVLMPILYLRCGALDRLRPGAVAASTSSTPSLNDVFAKLLSDTDVCEFDAVIMVDHPGVSSTTLPSLPSIFFVPPKP